MSKHKHNWQLVKVLDPDLSPSVTIRFRQLFKFVCHCGATKMVLEDISTGEVKAGKSIYANEALTLVKDEIGKKIAHLQLKRGGDENFTKDEILKFSAKIRELEDLEKFIENLENENN